MAFLKSLYSPLERQLAKVKHEIKPKKLRQLHEQVLFEYPFLANIYESMLVTDNQKPDCPIVYCNDLFEQMTCYPKEEIIGKNCRFLQGPDTDKEIVRNIRKAVDEGLELEVELLNYRKDGVPFYNVFLMLPIHAPKERSGPVHYFVAIQKDITILRQPGKDPRAWSKAEVGMWLYHVGLSPFMASFIQNHIDGGILFHLDDKMVQKYSPDSSPAERRVLLTKITELANNPASAYRVNSSQNSINYEGERSNKENLQLGEKVDTSKKRSWWRCLRTKSSEKSDKKDNSESKSEGEGEGEGETEVADPFLGLKEIGSSNMITMKIFYRKNIIIVEVPKTITYDLLIEKIEKLCQFPVKCRYCDLDGDWVSLEDDDCVEAAILCSNGGTVSIKVGKKFRPLSQEKQMYLNATPVGLVVIDSEQKIVFMNTIAQNMLNLEPYEYLRRKFPQIVGEIDTEIQGEQSFTSELGHFTAIISPDAIEYNRVIVLSKK